VKGERYDFYIEQYNTPVLAIETIISPPDVVEILDNSDLKGGDIKLIYP
jgi:hypothetical protein